MKQIFLGRSSHHHKKGWFDGNFLGRKKIMPFPAAKVSHECQIWHLSYEVIAWKLHYYSYFLRGNRDQTGDFNARKGVKKLFIFLSLPPKYDGGCGDGGEKRNPFCFWIFGGLRYPSPSLDFLSSSAIPNPVAAIRWPHFTTTSSFSIGGMGIFL